MIGIITDLGYFYHFNRHEIYCTGSIEEANTYISEGLAFAEFKHWDIIDANPRLICFIDKNKKSKPGY